MPGVTKHIYDHEIRDIMTMWNNQIKSIQLVLSKYYTEVDIVFALKHYYPHEWNSVEFKYSYYQTKDKYLNNHFGKIRYCMKKPEILLLEVSMYKKIVLHEYLKTYSDNYTEKERALAEEKLWTKRKLKIEKTDQKIEKALIKTQQVTPSFIDQLLGLYERKNTSQKDKMYILLELKKYYSPKIVQFFFKLNDTELNKQLREETFHHLQSFNYQPRARRQKYMQVHTKSAKRKKFLKDVYPYQTYTIPQNPNELEYRIENSKDQKLKEFDYFISHSSNDSVSVQELIRAENQQGKNVFCDWINDVDYLKRHLLCNATLKVIEKRLEQSKALIFVWSENSLNSIWCKYELNYFGELNKPMHTIRIEDIDSNIFDLKLLVSSAYIDSDYKNLALLESSRVFT
jgi:hypothetical protein